MNLTETEAKTRWCPFARQLVTLRNADNPIQLSSANRFEGEVVSLCIGSGCMAWRWSNKRLGHDPSLKGALAAAEFTRENPLIGGCGLVRGEP